MKLCLIVAVSNNDVIGKDGTIPWNIPEELKYFREKTTGHAVVQGSNTLKSIGRALPNRKNYVVCSIDPEVKDVEHCISLTDAINKAREAGHEKLFVIGGERMYRDTKALADEVYITRVNIVVEDGDTYFDSELNPLSWRLMSQSRTQGEHPLTYNYEHFVRR